MMNRGRNAESLYHLLLVTLRCFTGVLLPLLRCLPGLISAAPHAKFLNGPFSLLVEKGCVTDPFIKVQIRFMIRMEIRSRVKMQLGLAPLPHAKFPNGSFSLSVEKGGVIDPFIKGLGLG